MRPSTAVLRIAALAAVASVAISSCGGGKGASATPPMPAPMAMRQLLNTAQVLAQARATSESGAPYAVNDGALVLTDTSETAEPFSVVGP